jgi:hypothetical protein
LEKVVVIPPPDVLLCCLEIDTIFAVIIMTYRGHVKNGQIALDVPAKLLEGTAVNIEVLEQVDNKHRPTRRSRRDGFQPIEMPGGPLADDIIRDRR